MDLLPSDLVGHVAALCDPLALPHLARVNKAWRAATRRRWEGLRDFVHFLMERDGRVSWAGFCHWWEDGTTEEARQKRGCGLCIRRHVAAFARALERGVLLEERLTHLRLEHLIDLPPSVPLALALPASLLELSLERCGTLDLHGLRLPRALRRLALRRNALGDEGAAQLAAALRGLPSLTSLHVSGAGVGDVGVVHLAAALGASPLVHLNLRCNPFGRAGLDALAAAGPRLTSLRLCSLFSLHHTADDTRGFWLRLDRDAATLPQLCRISLRPCELTRRVCLRRRLFSTAFMRDDDAAFPAAA
jgi:hypothetical protein